MGLTSDQTASFERDGFLVARGVFSATEIAAHSRAIDALANRPPEIGRQMVYFEDSITAPGARVLSRIEKFVDYDAALAALVFDDRIVAPAAALLGDGAVLFKDKINFKMPGGAGFKAHQDQQAGWSTYAPLFVTVMVTLDPSTLENGCLELAPGRHREGLIGEQWVPLEESGLDLQPVPTAPGDVIFFDSFAPHASKANLTSAPRRILYLTYNLASQGDHRERYFADKHASFPPDIDRDREKTYVFRV
jgi:ectoine hydroxylase-related dioxygenase (phytanoyl-CoA dioxygenase family)